MEPLLWDAEWRTGIDGDYLLEQIDAAFTRLEAGLVPQNQYAEDGHFWRIPAGQGFETT